ncbi:von willebrand factor type a : von Willebrand factor type A OS=Pirellula staleyi (strain ATCC 27377 / DSM 6068 / ICPB 4128) GN=Psta_2654 PE=4 SV=1: VWA_3 [Gemmata massiliana]|uniref:VWFA domain-containing protein n=1 Tax=Gemmata massiliana TaxID=1210884 RepID=A0A6P2DIT8_9BACT|nr:hypothetical protein [Gemmata massiliana]VTS02553.1 von willebrand factor type a : von Willebrand factor type A OS=Pirellula staleyi (strain ATCC 27377 / DSM 6068 / ICPB 4128) GN=Psta_2654 PE=4 SV=1: VWA_3 [Gemmata massiliana]
MNVVNRLRLLPVLLGVSATLAALGTALWGDVRTSRSGPDAGPVSGRPDGGRLVEDLALTKFGSVPVLTYQPRDGELVFAWQVRPEVAAPAPRPRDVLVLVDTSASQAGRPLQQARQVVTGLAARLGSGDRVSVWSLSTPGATRALTAGFQAPGAENVAEAARALTEVEYGSGATDLKGGIEKALGTQAPNRGRHQEEEYLGDGESAFERVGESQRLALGGRMDRDDVGFFAVPLGVKLDAQNLHGLAALTGGAVVRVQEDLSQAAGQNEFAGRLMIALDVAVVKPETWSFGPEVGEVYPTKLPPLRADRSTLVMGKVAKAGAASVSATVSGTVGGKGVVLNLSQALPAPRVEHFFLNLMVSQWKGAPHKDAPAMLQSDRALALASTQVKLYRDEFLTQAVWAVSADRFEEAEKLYAAALKVNPTDQEAAHGSALVAKLRAGKLTKGDLTKQLNEKVRAKHIAPDQAPKDVLQEPKGSDAVPVAQPPANPGAGGADLVKEAAARRQVEEQRYRVLVDATIRRARQFLRTDPEGAYQDLKRQRDEVLGYDGLGAEARVRLVGDLESQMREVFVKGAEIRRQADAERQSLARTRQRLNEFDRAADAQASDKNRIDQFRQLMQHARYELAYQEAQLMVQEKTNKGLAVPPTATASYIIGQQATQLREWKELTRVREDRFLQAMMQTEKSHIPYPDEPPVHFPPAAVWRELTGYRKEAYQNSNLGASASQSQKELKKALDRPVDLGDKNLNEVPLFELLSFLSKQYGVSFVVMEEYFNAEQQPNIKESKPKLASTQLKGLTLGNFLDIVLLSMNATYIVRPEYVEITTFNRRLEEKVTQVFPVADLVIPIPQSVNQRTLFQNQQFQNQSLAIFGQASLFGGGLQNIGGNFGNPFGAGGVGVGGGNPLNAMGNGGPFGGTGQQLGNQGNQGIGGGITGITGGQLGQFGNLGGQFGLQGGDQSQLLMRLIFETVAKGEWANIPNAQPMPGMGEDEVPTVDALKLNSLGYYPPARALIVRGTTRYHSATTIKLKKTAEGNAQGPGVARPGGGALVLGPGGNGAPANAVAGVQPKLVNPKVDPVGDRQKLGTDPRTMWSSAIDRTVTDPGLIVACAEFLMEFEEYGHAAEVLKGNLRKGLATEGWAHEALAVALRASGASPSEVERASVSGIDLDPTSAKAYLGAARAEAELKNHDRAVSFCRRAAACSPEDPTPYANALAYADQASAVRTDAVMWAANGLLGRDWNTSDGIDYHQQARDRLPQLEARLKGAGQDTGALSEVLGEQTRRDLVIELQWQGNADLDLVVGEPTGSVCSSVHTRTTGGGVLKGDQLAQGADRSEVYAAARAFSGVYAVSVKQAFGRPLGGSARIKVTRFQGTERQSVDLLEVPVDGKGVEVKLDGGSRTTLAVLSEEALSARAVRSEWAGAGLGESGLGAGFGTAGSALGAPVVTSGGVSAPLVSARAETREAGISAGAADIRATYKLNPDRKSFRVDVTPVFAGAKGEIALPTVPLLPGAEK